MNNSGSDFSTVKVGDRLWLRDNWYEGFVKVNAIYSDSINVIGISSPHASRASKVGGKWADDGPQVLFWDKVAIVPLPRPKRMVKKTVMVRPYRYEGKIYFKSGEDLMPHAEDESLFCGPVQPIEIEVWEE